MASANVLFMYSIFVQTIQGVSTLFVVGNNCIWQSRIFRARDSFFLHMNSLVLLYCILLCISRRIL